MKNFTRKELVLKISEEQPHLTQTEIVRVLQKTLDHITNALAAGRNVELRNFGIFEVILRKAKPGRNPKNPGVNVPIPARAVVKFSSGKIMRHRVLELTNQLL
ncbi:MAG: integration host factor subunit beta [Verrucomicrobia bacterium]|nr:integration host factor subunit beta [Verrucomicrobiota bacterium]